MGTETIFIPIIKYTTDTGSHTCATDFTEGDVCMFLHSRSFGMKEYCCFAPDRALSRTDRGTGYLVPDRECPLKIYFNQQGETE